jgi:copper(I)-binding protein
MHSKLCAFLSCVAFSPIAMITPVDAATVTNAWARPGTDDIAVYFTLRDETVKPLTLIGVGTPRAQHAQIHHTVSTSMSVNGVGMSGMDMHDKGTSMETVQSVTVEPRQEIIFEPGGYHVMIDHLKRPLKLGEHFLLTLKFRDHTHTVVNVAVKNG